MSRTSSLRIGAVGDIAFEGPLADRPDLACFSPDVVARLRQTDLAVANLECALTRASGDGIPGKCTLRGSPGWASVLKQAGIGMVSLANNHVMDYGPQGLLQTMDALRQAGVTFVGAGRDLGEARAPVVMQLGGQRVVFIARSAVIVSAPTYAAPGVPGVAFLDVEETVDTIRASRADAARAVVLLHWGLEEYAFPSPSQRSIAKRLLKAGADLVIGHHPHVLQGVERIGTGMVAYSLGNFAFDEFEWGYVLEDGSVSPQLSGLSPANRKGAIATFEWDGGQASTLPKVTMISTRIGDRACVSIDPDPRREQEWRELCEVLERRSLYGAWWRAYALRREWALRLGEQASPAKALRNLHRIRPRHVARAFAAMLRSLRIVGQKSTNPYE